MAIIGDIRQIDTLCTVSLRRTHVPACRREGVAELTFNIPEELAREAIQETSTQAEAEAYVSDRIDSIRLEWPEFANETLKTKDRGVESGSII